MAVFEAHLRWHIQFYIFIVHKSVLYIIFYTTISGQHVIVRNFTETNESVGRGVMRVPLFPPADWLTLPGAIYF